MRKWVSIAVVLVAIIVVVFGYELYRNREPRYHGRRLRDCIWESWNAGDKRMVVANEAVQACGTDAIRYYLKLIKTKPESPLKNKLLDFLDKQNWPNFGLVRNTAEQSRTFGRIGLVLLGSRAGAAVPTVAQWAFDDKNKDFSEAGYLLTSLGTEGVGVLTNVLAHPKAKNRWFAAQLAGNYARDNWLEQPRPPEEIEFAANALVPYLIAGLGDPDLGVRNCSIESLSLFRREAETVVPIVAGILQNPTNDWGLNIMMMNALSRYGPKARDAVPALMTVLNGHDEANCRQAGGLLVKLDRSSIPAVVDRFSKLFQDPQTTRDYRESAIYYLEYLGKDAKSAAPALLALCQNDKRFLLIASTALVKIDPETAINSGVNLTAIFDSGLTTARVTALTAIQALGDFGSPAKGSIPPLLYALKNRDPEVRRAAGIALKKIAPEEAAKAGVE